MLGLLLLFLLSYVNAHLLRAKQKSFAAADHSGHGAADCGPPVFGETLLLGSLAILAGIALGAFLSQLASFVVFRAFGESYRLQPGLFPDTLAQTLLFFGGIFLVVGLRNLVLVRRLPVLSMLQADRKTESFPLRTQMRGWIPAVLLVSTAAGGLILSLLSRLSFPLPWLLALLLVLAPPCGTWLREFGFFGPAAAEAESAAVSALPGRAAGRGRPTGSVPTDEIFGTPRRTPSLSHPMPPLLALLLVVFALVGLFSTLSWSLSRPCAHPSPGITATSFSWGS